MQIKWQEDKSPYKGRFVAFAPGLTLVCQQPSSFAGIGPSDWIGFIRLGKKGRELERIWAGQYRRTREKAMQDAEDLARNYLLNFLAGSLKLLKVVGLLPEALAQENLCYEEE